MPYVGSEISERSSLVTPNLLASEEPQGCEPWKGRQAYLSVFTQEK